VAVTGSFAKLGGGLLSQQDLQNESISLKPNKVQLLALARWPNPVRFPNQLLKEQALQHCLGASHHHVSEYVLTRVSPEATGSCHQSAMLSV